MSWINYFVTSLHAEGTEGHLAADSLADRIAAHKGGEAYHCAFDLVSTDLKCEEITDELDDKGKPIRRYHAPTKEALARWQRSVSKYEGPMRPAFGYAWFDFDSKDGGVQAFAHANDFRSKIDGHVFCYSGSKGFHVGVPLSALGLKEGPELGKQLNRIATALKKSTYESLDTTVFNANRKFRVLGSRHPKTKLFKILLDPKASLSLDAIKALAKTRGELRLPQAPTGPVAPEFAKLAGPEAAPSKDSISLAEWRRYRQPSGARAFEECLFLKHAKENAAKIDEPQWYAAASIVGRFENGAAQFHAISSGHPGYSKSATDEKLSQALQASGPRKCEAIAQVWTGCGSCQHFQRIKSPIVIMEKELIPTEATGFYDLIENDNPASKSYGEVKRIPNYDDLLKAFHRDRPYKTIADMRAVFVFDKTHYVDYTPIEIRSFAEDNFDPKPKESMRTEFYSKVLANQVARKSFFQQGTENRINFKNGVLELETKDLMSHSPDFGFRHVLPYDFSPAARSPIFDAWLRQVMLGDAELIAILQEFMGYVLSGCDYRYHKALWLSGTGRNGKSTFLSVLKALIGAGNYSTLSIRQIIGDKFSSADLDGKIANFSEETSPEELSDSGPFKNLTGDGELIAQKKYGDPYSFRNRAKLIMTYNEVPLLKDLSPGMLSRPIIIPWNLDLTDESKQDKNLQKKLLAELSGIFNFALAGWERLESRGEFTKSEKSVLALQEIRESSCSAAQWMRENVEFIKLDNIGPIKPRTLYDAYKATIGQYAYSENKFYKRINSIPEITDRRRRTEKGMEYFAMRLRSSIDF